MEILLKYSDQMIIYFWCLLASAAMIYVVAKITDNKIKLSLKQTLLIVINGLNFFIRYVTTDSIVAILLSAVIFGIIVKLNFNISIKKSYIVVAIVYVLSLLVEITIGVLLLCIINLIELSNYEIMMISFINIFFALFLYLSINNKKILNFLQKIYQNFSINTWLLTVVALLIMLYSAYKMINPLTLDNDTLAFIAIIVTILGAYVSLVIEKFRLQALETELNTLTKYAESYEKMINDKIKFHHETRNQLLTIKGLIKDDKETFVYVDSILDDYKLETYAEFDNLFSNLPHSPIRSLLIYKLSEIKNKEISYDLSIDKRYRKLNISINDQKVLCKILGTIIDNAVNEAIKLKGDDRFVTLDFRNDTKELKIIVANSINKKLTSKSKKFRGFGLILAFDLVKHHKKISLKTEINNGCYTQNLVYKKK